jgi:hypothetical protein
MKKALTQHGGQIIEKHFLIREEGKESFNKDTRQSKGIL